jgi:2-desacetyl-2-hydroxyethyl bacteriochlorophyllide A dehydrogenase
VAGDRIRQVVIERPNQVTVRDADVAAPGPGEALVATRQVGICGSDLHALAGRHPFVPLPCRPGHEVVGIVQQVADGVTTCAPGDRVLVEPNLVCGWCRYCLSGRYNICQDLRVFGCQTSGAMAEQFVLPADRLLPAPEELSDTEATLAEPLSTCTHAIRMAGGVEGRTVAVLGAGSIGVLLLLAARAVGAAAVATTDPVASKRARALRLGAVAAVDPREPDAVPRVGEALRGRPDVTFDCVANQSSMDQAVALAQRGGTIVVVGVPTSSVSIALPLVQDREIRIEGSLMYVREDVLKAVELLRAGAVPVEEVVTATFPLERAPEAFQAARSGEHVKVHLVVPAEG